MNGASIWQCDRERNRGRPADDCRRIGDPGDGHDRRSDAMWAVFNFGLIDASSTATPGITFGAPLTNNGDLSIEPNCSMTINAAFNAGTGVIHDNGTLRINGPITGSAINQAGNGTLIINPTYKTAAPSAFGNALVLLNGPGNAISTVTGNATLVVATGAAGKPGPWSRMVVSGSTRSTVNGAVQIRPNGTANGTSKVQHLTLAGNTAAWQGALDLTNNAFVVAISDSSTLPTIVDQINYGAASGSTDGIFTTTPNMGIALIDNSALATPLTSFGGVPVDANSILLRGALLGDANLDGQVDLSDLSVVLNNFGQTTANWLAGNFDHEATVDLTDLSFVLNNFGQNQPLAAPSVGGQTAAAPEPGSILALAAVPLLVTRRSRIRRLH